MAFANLPRRPSQRILKLLKFSSPHQIATVRRSGEYSAIQREIRPFPGTRCAEPVWANPVISRDFPASPKAQRDLWRGALAERVGFEPTVPFQVRRISSAVLSTTQPPLRSRLGASDLRGPPSEGGTYSSAGGFASLVTFVQGPDHIFWSFAWAFGGLSRTGILRTVISEGDHEH